MLETITDYFYEKKEPSLVDKIEEARKYPNILDYTDIDINSHESREIILKNANRISEDTGMKFGNLFLCCISESDTKPDDELINYLFHLINQMDEIDINNFSNYPDIELGSGISVIENNLYELENIALICNIALHLGKINFDNIPYWNEVKAIPHSFLYTDGSTYKYVDYSREQLHKFLSDKVDNTDESILQTNIDEFEEYLAFLSILKYYILSNNISKFANRFYLEKSSRDNSHFM